MGGSTEITEYSAILRRFSFINLSKRPGLKPAGSVAESLVIIQMNIREIPDNKQQELRYAADGESNLPVPVSVIIPAFNSAAFLGRAVESVLEQTLDGIEIIVVDDGSTDATAEIARAFGDRVRYLRQENGG